MPSVHARMDLSNLYRSYMTYEDISEQHRWHKTSLKQVWFQPLGFSVFHSWQFCRFWLKLQFSLLGILATILITINLQCGLNDETGKYSE